MVRLISLVIAAFLLVGGAQAASKTKQDAKFVANYDKGKAAYLDKEYALALRHFTELAEEKDDNRARFFLGFMNETGRGLPQNINKAYEHYVQAATGREMRAMYSMGYFHEYGFVVKRDMLAAHMWYNLAAAAGHRDARIARDVLSSRLSPKELVEAQELARSWDASH